MSNPAGRFFHTAALRQRYLDELDSGLHRRDFGPFEYVWLKRIAQPTVASDADPARADHITLAEGLIRPFELSAAVMFSHRQGSDARVYLFTLSRGVERFEDRPSLLARLRERFNEGDPQMVFESEKIAGDPFRAQMLAIVDHQVQQAGALTEQFKRMPSLYNAASAVITDRLNEVFVQTSIDPGTHLLQIVGDANSDLRSVPVTQTLTQAVFDDYCQVPLKQGLARRFLDARGGEASAADAALFAQALKDAKAGIPQTYATVLKDFWEGEWRAGRTRRELAIESLKDSLRREVYRCRHEGALTMDAVGTFLQLLEPDPARTSSQVCSCMAIRIGDSASVKLAGTFVVRSGSDKDTSLVWVSSRHVLMEFADLAALTEHLATGEGVDQLRPTLAIQEQSVLQEEGQWRIELQAIDPSPFAERIDSIIAMQARNLEYLAGITCAPESVMAMTDDALDIRTLIDPWQRPLNAGRWRDTAVDDFLSLWPQPQTSVSTSAPLASNQRVSVGQNASDRRASGGDSTAASWSEYAQAFDDRAARLRTLDTVLLDYAGHTLQPYVCLLFDGKTLAKDLRIQWTDPTTAAPPEKPSWVSRDLVPWLLECVSGHRPRTLSASAQVRLESGATAKAVPAELVDHLLGKVLPGFTERYVQRFKQSQGEFLRQGDRHVQPDSEALALREDAMRLDLALATRQKRIGSAPIEMARQVLDRPVRSLRTSLGVAVTEAFCIALSYHEKPAVVLDDMLLLRDPLDSNGAVMLWRGTMGWRYFASVTRFQEVLRRTLLRTHSLRGLSDASDRSLKIHLQRIDGHAVASVQQSVSHWQIEDVQQLCTRAVRSRFQAGLFSRLARVVERDGQLQHMLDALSVRIDNSIFEAMLPSWIDSASVSQLKLYYQVLRRLYLVSESGRDFLFDVPALQDFARIRVMDQIGQDFPGKSLDPDLISLTSRRYVIAPAAVGQLPSALAAATTEHQESLTEYAINRFVKDQGTVLSFDSSAQPEASGFLTLGYLQELVQRLDTGAAYMRLLRQALAPDDANYALRTRLFVAQMPATLLAVALPELLKNKLSAPGYAFIASVVDMPDGIAREPVQGRRVILSPLQLVADEGMSPDPVSGVYLICPADSGKGPVVLYALFNPAFTFREFASRQALMDAVRQDPSLQQLLLERLEPEVRRRYDHGGFVEPHLPFSVGLYDVPVRAPGPVTLALSEVTGNSLNYLFDGTVKVLLDLGVSNAVTNAQATQASRTYLATLGLQQALTFVPGKLAQLVTLWQSQTLFRAAATSASGHHWGEALSEFSAALGVMAAARERTVEEQFAEDGSLEVQAPMDESALPWAFSWRGTSLNAEQRLRLSALEAQGVALSEMRHDKLLNIYLDRNDTPYAVVAGKVYRVRRIPEEGRWIIVGADATTGPQLTLDSRQRWQLDLNLRLRGGGGAVTRIKESAATSSAEGALVIEARGMAEIRSLYRNRAIQIGQAHLQAKRYLENSLDNLGRTDDDTALDPRVARIISDFFAIPSPDSSLVNDVANTITKLFDAVMDASLSPFSSPRFVLGSNRPGNERVTAFTIPEDPQQRVFLTERFFRTPGFHLNEQAAAEGFDTGAHYRAATLIHELSHLVFDTKDIAYLETSAPYPDLLLANNAVNLRLKTQIQRLHEHRFSAHTPENDLFTVFVDGQWRDLNREDGLGYASILRITDTKSLKEARKVFLSDSRKRSQVMLKNADSVTLLILLLGRKNIVPPSPD
jgi:hypothetical protein